MKLPRKYTFRIHGQVSLATMLATITLSGSTVPHPMLFKIRDKDLAVGYCYIRIPLPERQLGVCSFDERVSAGLITPNCSPHFRLFSFSFRVSANCSSIAMSDFSRENS